MHTPKAELSKGATTEFCSEALGQICLAWAISQTGPLTVDMLVNAPLSRQTRESGKWDNFSDNGGLNMRTIGRISQLCIFAERASTWNRWGQIFADFISRPLNPKLQQSNNNPNWVAAQFRYMSFIKNRYNLNRSYKIVNDKVMQRGGRIGGANPYTALMNTGVSGTMRDKWNPADIWCINREGIASMRRLNQQLSSRREKPSIEIVNQFMANQYNNRNIIPLSLKKPRGVVDPHLDVINSGEFVQTIALGKSSGGPNDVIEFDSNPTRGQANQDMKINFTIQTVELPAGMRGLKEAARVRRGHVIPGSRVVPDSRKHIRIKYHVNNKKLELEYTQTGGDSYAAAKMGNIGSANFQRIIEGTSRSGISKLTSIQSKYSDIDIKTTPWFNANQLDIGSLSSANRVRNENRVEPHRMRMQEYLDEIWKEINGSNMTQLDKERFQTSMSLWNKSRAGEVGLAVGGINNIMARRRVVQNLYELAASIADVVGLSSRDMGSEFMNISSMKTAFRSSAYVKVY